MRKRKDAHPPARTRFRLYPPVALLLPPEPIHPPFRKLNRRTPARTHVSHPPNIYLSIVPLSNPPSLAPLLAPNPIPDPKLNFQIPQPTNQTPGA